LNAETQSRQDAPEPGKRASNHCAYLHGNFAENAEFCDIAIPRRKKKDSEFSRWQARLHLFASYCSFCVLAALPSIFRPQKAQTSTSVSIVNNSSRFIRHVYLSHVYVDDWSSNQLGDSVISAGQSFTLSDIACDQQQAKVIAEDQDGCFLSTVVACGGNVEWTITNETARDCGN